MNKAEATRIFLEYVSKDYKEVEIEEMQEREGAYLFSFKEKRDNFPVDYPVISISKEDGKVRRLSYLNSKDRAIIMGR